MQIFPTAQMSEKILNLSSLQELDLNQGWRQKKQMRPKTTQKEMGCIGAHSKQGGVPV